MRRTQNSTLSFRKSYWNNFSRNTSMISCGSQKEFKGEVFISGKSGPFDIRRYNDIDFTSNNVKGDNGLESKINIIMDDIIKENISFNSNLVIKRFSERFNQEISTDNVSKKIKELIAKNLENKNIAIHKSVIKNDEELFLYKRYSCIDKIWGCSAAIQQYNPDSQENMLKELKRILADLFGEKWYLLKLGEEKIGDKELENPINDSVRVKLSKRNDVELIFNKNALGYGEEIDDVCETLGLFLKDIVKKYEATKKVATKIKSTGQLDFHLYLNDEKLFDPKNKLPANPLEYENMMRLITDSNGVFPGDNAKIDYKTGNIIEPNSGEILGSIIYSKIERVDEHGKKIVLPVLKLHPKKQAVSVKNRLIFDLDLVSQIAAFERYGFSGGTYGRDIPERRYFEADKVVIVTRDGMPSGFTAISNNEHKNEAYLFIHGLMVVGALNGQRIAQYMVTDILTEYFFDKGNRNGLEYFKHLLKNIFKGFKVAAHSGRVAIFDLFCKRLNVEIYLQENPDPDYIELMEDADKSVTSAADRIKRPLKKDSFMDPKAYPNPYTRYQPTIKKTEVLRNFPELKDVLSFFFMNAGKDILIPRYFPSEDPFWKGLIDNDFLSKKYPEMKSYLSNLEEKIVSISDLISSREYECFSDHTKKELKDLHGFLIDSKENEAESLKALFFELEKNRIPEDERKMKYFKHYFKSVGGKKGVIDGNSVYLIGVFNILKMLILKSKIKHHENSWLDKFIKMIERKRKSILSNIDKKGEKK